MSGFQVDRRRALALGLGSAAIGAAVLISSSGAASPAQGLISGSYVLDPERSDDAVQAIDRGVAGPSSAARHSFARRLRKAAAPPYAIRISIAAARFSIKRDAHPLITVLIGGEPIGLWLESGELFDVSAKANGDAISLTFREANSERTIVFRSVGQQLVTETVIVSPLLSAPIRYKLVYNRAS